MPKRMSETERLIGFAMSATQDALNSASNPKPINRKCTQCEWTGKTAFPEPCPKCSEKTEAA